jgi:integrase
MSQKHRVGHLFRRGKNFYVRWVVEGKVFSKALRDEGGRAITRKEEAERAQRKLMAPFTVASEAEALESIVGKLEGRKAELARLEDQRSLPLSLAQAWSEFMASPRRPDTGPATLVIYEYQFAKFTDWMKLKHPELVAMRDVSRVIAEDYVAVLNRNKPSPNTYNKHLNVLTMVYRVLEEKAKLAGNPWERIQRRRLTPHSRRELSLEELRKVCQGATGEFRLLFALGIYTGLREGDCATLHWGEVDLARGIIRRVPNKTARRSQKPVIVPIHPVLRGMLTETAPEERGDYVLPETADDYLNNRTELVRKIQAHFKACGIRVHKPVEETKEKVRQRPVIEVGFHSLRHTFVSLCRESNAPLAVVESIVGHSNPAMTRHYTHVGEVAAGQAVAALPWVIGEATPTSDGDKEKEVAALVLKMRGVWESVSSKSWKEKKAEGLALVSVIEAAVGKLAGDGRGSGAGGLSAGVRADAGRNA